MEIKTEADSNDITCCSRYDKPTTGMFAVSDEHVLFPVYCICFNFQ